MKEEIHFTRPAEQWSNGLYCQWFEHGEWEISLKQHHMKSADDEECTYLSFADAPVGEPWEKRCKREAHPLRHIKSFDGIITPRAAIMIINLLERRYAEGFEAGQAHTKAEIRSLLGVKP